MFFKHSNSDKATKLEAKGDKSLEKGDAKRALKSFKKALEFDPSRTALYEKMIKTRDMLPGDWKMKDFVESVNWVMERQEKENPPIKQVHAKLSPEWENANKLVVRIMSASSKEESDKVVEKLVDMGEIGTRAVVDLLLKLKEASEKPHDENEEAEDDQNLSES